MPFKSKSQARFMYAAHPRLAKKWAKHTRKAKFKRLPEKVSPWVNMSSETKKES